MQSSSATFADKQLVFPLHPFEGRIKVSLQQGQSVTVLALFASYTLKTKHETGGEIGEAET